MSSPDGADRILTDEGSGVRKVSACSNELENRLAGHDENFRVVCEGNEADVPRTCGDEPGAIGVIMELSWGQNLEAWPLDRRLLRGGVD